MKKRKSLLKSVAYCFGLIVVFFVVQMIVSIPFGLAYGQNIQEKQILLGLISSSVFLFLIVFVFLMKKKNALKEIGCNKFRLAAGILPLSGALLFSWSYNIGLNRLAPADLLQSIKQQTENTYTSGLFIAVLCVMIIQPAAEEVLFRGLIMKRLLQHLPPGIAVFASAFLFSAVHLMAGAYLLPMTFIGGLIFAYAYYKSGSLIPAILAHMGANAGGLVSDLWDYSAINPSPVIIIFLLLSAILLFAFSRTDRRPGGKRLF